MNGLENKYNDSLSLGWCLWFCINAAGPIESVLPSHFQIWGAREAKKMETIEGNNKCKALIM